MNIANFQTSLLASWYLIFPRTAKLILALVLLLVGLLVARLLGWLTTMILKTIWLDKGAVKIGFNTLLDKANIKKSASELIGDLVYWFTALVAVIGILGGFGLRVGGALTMVLTYMGIVLLAALVLGIGVFLAGLISSLVRVVLANFGVEGARTISRVIYYIVIIFTFLAALAELGIKPDVFLPQIGVVIGAFGLAAAIAFGLGCKDMAADFLHNIFKGK